MGRHAVGLLLASLQAPEKDSPHGEGRKQPLELVPQMDFKGSLWAAEKGVSGPVGRPGALKETPPRLKVLPLCLRRDQAVIIR